MKKTFTNVLITGGSSGIGLALAKQLAGEGANVCLLARDQQRLASAQQVVQECTIRTDQIISTLSCDITDYPALENTLNQWLSNNKIPDLVINSAGVTYPGYFQELDIDTFHWLMDINYYGTVHVCKLLIPEMLGRKSGTIVNLSSQAGFVGIFGYTGYSASKFAVRGFSDTLRAEMKPHGIQISVVFPPDTQTPQLQFEDPLKPFETRDLAGNVKIESAEKVAEIILRETRKGRYFIIPGFGGKFFYQLIRFMGNWTYPIMDWLVSSAQKKMRKFSN